MKVLARIMGIIFFIGFTPLFVTRVDSPTIKVTEEKEPVAKKEEMVLVFPKEELEIRKVEVPKKEVVKENSLLEFANNKMKDLLETNYWSHTNSDGCDFKCRVKSYEYEWIGENLYKGPCNRATAFSMWNESPAHNDVLKHSYSHEVLLEKEYKTGYCYIILIRAEL